MKNARLVKCIGISTLLILLAMPVVTPVHSWSIEDVQFSTAAFDPDLTDGLTLTGPVAVLEDADPWGYNSVEDILNGWTPMDIDVIPSSSFGVTDLSMYQKVIISSSQSASFYDALVANRTWIESYVLKGGILEYNAARAFAMGDTILPFGFGYVYNATDDVEVADPTHFLLNTPFVIDPADLDGWNSAAHAYLNNTDDATIILTNQYDLPVLIEQHIGCGYIIITCQPVEWAYGYVGYTEFLENLVMYAPTAFTAPDGPLTGPVAVIQDHPAWQWLSANSTQKVLVKYGIGYDIINSTYFGSVDLSGYQKVIISADQDLPFITALEANKTWLEDYVINGGVLEIHAATQGPDWVLPGDIMFNYTGSETMVAEDPFHTTLYRPYWIRTPELESHSYATHGYFTNTIGSNIILTNGVDPVVVEKVLGDGLIIATGQTIEYSWHNNFTYMLENLIHYMPGMESPALGPRPNDRVIEFGSTGHSLSWTPIDCRFVSYNVTRNGVLIDTDDWTGQEITFGIDGLAVGTYEFLCSLGDAYGNTAQDVVMVIVEDTTSPIFVEPLVDQIIGAGSEFTLDANASDLSGIDHWWISDTDSFSISGTGVITSNEPLQAGVYEIEVRAYDPYDNYGSDTFTLTVVAPFPLEILAIVGGAAVVIILLVILRMKKAGGAE